MRFTDSLRFMSSLLKKLVVNLIIDGFQVLEKQFQRVGRSACDADLIKQEEFYLDSYMGGFEKSYQLC